MTDPWNWVGAAMIAVIVIAVIVLFARGGAL